MSRRTKRVPVRTRTLDEDFTLKMAHLLREIEHKPGYYTNADTIVRRAFAFNGRTVVLRDGRVVES